MAKSKLEQLKAPFKDEDIEWRVGRSGETNGRVWAVILPYITARACQDRLDDVLGPENWFVDYRHVGDKGVICRLSVKIGEETALHGGWVSKEDGSEESEIESFKGGISGAFKRACVLVGIGRYLYSLGERFANVVSEGTPGANYAKLKSGRVFWWTVTPPQGVTPKPEAPSLASPADYLITFGKFNGKRLGDVDPFDIEDYLKWLNSSGKMSPKAKELETMFEKLADQKNAPNGSDDFNKKMAQTEQTEFNDVPF